jgi:hypothetical protein
MLTRRGFAGFASCALCGIGEFIATEASAQGAPAATIEPKYITIDSFPTEVCEME